MEPVRLESLPPRARELIDESLAWMESYGDATVSLLRYPSDHGNYAHYDSTTKTLHLIRESAWWALALLVRDCGDDAERAALILESVLAWQIDEPGMPYHGTFHRTAQEPRPSGRNAAMWAHYDPNWREFIGTTFLVILELLPDRLPPLLIQRLEASVRLAIEGEPADRVSPSYTNIAIMYAIMLVNGGERYGQPDWTERGLKFAREIYDLYTPHETFCEYNSPTYYGINLYALRLWRTISPRVELAEWGAKMERGLWNDVARYYHPRLRNMCGPFDRAYGMDMTQYVSCLGLCLRLEIPRQNAPLPSASRNFEHAHDFALAPVVALLGCEFSAEVRASLFQPVTGRQVQQVIEKERVATAYLGPDRMWGAQRGNKECSRNQFHAVTAHWRQPDRGVGWLRLDNGVPVDAEADAHGVRLTAKNGAMRGTLTWRFSCTPVVRDNSWIMPGMTVRLKGNAVKGTTEDSGRAIVQTLPPRTESSLALEFVPDDGRNDKSLAVAIAT